MVAILDYGIGNIASISNMLKKIGISSIITNSTEEISKAGKLILPGVGHFDYCMQQLRKSGFFDLLERRVMVEGVPLLGVCVGCQMLMERSEEGKEQGLGWIPGSVVRFQPSRMEGSFKIPHMGWTDVQPVSAEGLYAGIADPRFYFVHSYHVVCDEAGTVSATANYGYTFTASVKQKNIQGVQFHPEKSHKFGMQLYRNFANSQKSE